MSSVDELTRVCNGTAELLHEKTGAPYVLVILSGPEGGMVVGAWAPDVDQIRAIAGDLVAKIEKGQVRVKDLRR